MEDEYSVDCLPGDLEELELEVGVDTEDKCVSIHDNGGCDETSDHGRGGEGNRRRSRLDREYELERAASSGSNASNGGMQANVDESSVVGSGSFGAVLRCRRRSDAKIVVLKRVDIEKASAMYHAHDNGNLCANENNRVGREVRALVVLSHPNVVTYYDSFVDNGSLYICMELLPRGDMEQRLARMRETKTFFSERLLLHQFSQLCLACEHVHSKGIIHRDIKSSNILIGGDNITVKLGDFGVAAFVEDGGGAEAARTAVGTPFYFSPEMCKGARYGTMADMWSMGCVLYEMATLEHAFQAHCLVSIIMKIIRGQFDIGKVEDVYGSRRRRTDPIPEHPCSPAIDPKKEEDAGVSAPSAPNSAAPKDAGGDEGDPTMFFDDDTARRNADDLKTRQQQFKSSNTGERPGGDVIEPFSRLSTPAMIINRLLVNDPSSRASARTLCQTTELAELISTMSRRRSSTFDEVHDAVTRELNEMAQTRSSNSGGSSGGSSGDSSGGGRSSLVLWFYMCRRDGSRSD